VRQRLRYRPAKLGPCAEKTRVFGAAWDPIFGGAVQGTPLDRFRSSTGALVDGAKPQSPKKNRESSSRVAAAVLHARLIIGCAAFVAHSPCSERLAAARARNTEARIGRDPQPQPRKCRAACRRERRQIAGRRALTAAHAQQQYYKDDPPDRHGFGRSRRL